MLLSNSLYKLASNGELEVLSSALEISKIVLTLCREKE